MGFPVAMFDYTLKVPRRARQVRRGPEVLAKIVQDGGKQPGKLDCMGLTPRKIGSQLKIGNKNMDKALVLAGESHGILPFGSID